MLTAAQQGKFFKLARAAYSVVSPGVPFDQWRKAEMVAAGHPDSIADVGRVWGYEELMLRFAVMAYDYSAIGYFTSCSERRLRWVLNGLATDLQHIQARGVDEAYIEGIYRQAGMLPAEFADAPAPRLWCVLQILDTRIRRLCEREGIALCTLPTAGKPWEFRGIRAALYAAFVARSAERAGTPPADAGQRPLSSGVGQ